MKKLKFTLENYFNTFPVLASEFEHDFNEDYWIHEGLSDTDAYLESLLCHCPDNAEIIDLDNFDEFMHNWYNSIEKGLS